MDHALTRRDATLESRPGSLFQQHVGVRAEEHYIICVLFTYSLGSILPVLLLLVSPSEQRWQSNHGRTSSWHPSNPFPFQVRTGRDCWASFICRKFPQNRCDPFEEVSFLWVFFQGSPTTNQIAPWASAQRAWLEASHLGGRAPHAAWKPPRRGRCAARERPGAVKCGGFSTKRSPPFGIDRKATRKPHILGTTILRKCFESARISRSFQTQKAQNFLRKSSSGDAPHN